MFQSASINSPLARQDDPDEIPSSQMVPSLNRGQRSTQRTDDTISMFSSQMSQSGTMFSSQNNPSYGDNETFPSSHISSYDQSQMLSFSQLAAHSSEPEPTLDDILSKYPTESDNSSMFPTANNVPCSAAKSSNSEISFSQILEDISRKRAANFSSSQGDERSNAFHLSSGSSLNSSTAVGPNLFSAVTTANQFMNSKANTSNIVYKPSPFKPSNNVFKTPAPTFASKPSFPGGMSASSLMTGTTSPLKYAGLPGNPFQTTNNNSANLFSNQNGIQSSTMTDNEDDDTIISSSQPVVSSLAPKRPVFGKSSQKVSQAFKPVFKIPATLQNTTKKQVENIGKVMTEKIIEQTAVTNNILKERNQNVNSVSTHSSMASKLENNANKSDNPKSQVFKTTHKKTNAVNGSSGNKVTSTLKKTNIVPKPKLLIKSEVELCNVKESQPKSSRKPKIEQRKMKVATKTSITNPVITAKAKVHLNESDVNSSSNVAKKTTKCPEMKDSDKNNRSERKNLKQKETAISPLSALTVPHESSKLVKDEGELHNVTSEAPKSEATEGRTTMPPLNNSHATVDNHFNGDYEKGNTELSSDATPVAETEDNKKVSSELLPEEGNEDRDHALNVITENHNEVSTLQVNTEDNSSCLISSTIMATAGTTCQLTCTTPKKVITSYLYQ